MKFNLIELQAANVPAMTAERVATIPETATADEAEQGRKLIGVMDEYFKHFARPSDDGKCLGCDGIVQPKNMAEAFIRGTFRWGIAHGEWFCNACGYPGRAIHEIEGVGRIANLALQYHPSELKIRTPELEEV